MKRRYNTNKAGTGNAGLNWIEKGGGYYSQCNAKLNRQCQSPGPTVKLLPETYRLPAQFDEDLRRPATSLR